MCWRIAVLLGMWGGVAFAASPKLTAITPPGVQRGVETDVTITGDHLSDARGLLIYSPGIEVISMQAADDKTVHARVRVAADCALGDHDTRVWTASGISELLPFYVGPFPNVASSGSNHNVATAQVIPINTTVTGIIHDEEIDYFSIQVKKGERITAEAEGMRLGRDMFDPWAAILDAHGKQLAANDDNALLMQDPLVTTLAPEDGTYLVAIRDSTWGGSNTSAYRLHVGTYPQPVAVYPPGGKAGESVAAQFVGDIEGPIYAPVKLPSAADAPFAAELAEGGVTAPTPVAMRVSAFANVLEQEPNDDVAHATVDGAGLPIAFNGIIQQAGDRDFFKFHGTHGQVLDLTVYARQLRSPLDSVLDVWDAQGKHLAGNDDTNGPDSYLRFNVPADGDYCVSVRDQMKRGGPTYVYRVEVTPVTASVAFTLPEIVKDSQERQSVVVARGNRYATMLRTKREGMDDFKVEMPNLPPGVTVVSGSRAGDLVPVVFEATPDAVVSATLSDVKAVPVDAAKHAESGYSQSVEVLIGAPNNYAYLKRDVQSLPVSVADEAPFRIELEPPAEPILQDGVSALKVTAVRKAGFTGAINISMLYNPPGLNSQATITMPGNQTSVDFPISTNGDARAKAWQVAVIGSADAGHGMVWASSTLTPLTVARPFISGKLQRASVVRGQPVTVTCDLSQNVAFDGKAKIKLMGLPAKVTAQDVEVTASDKQAVFQLTTDATSPAGTHRDLFCEVTIEKDGAKIVGHTAGGGVLRIDQGAAPQPPKKEVAAQ